MNSFKIVASSTESTVVAEYTPEKRKSTDYQSETALEQDFINRLVSQGYEYITIKSEQDLIDNLRTQLEKLNNYTFFDKEWNDFYNSVISNGNDGIVEKTRKIQEDYLQNLTLDNGYVKNIKLIDKTNIHNNHLQVINQYEEDGGKYDTRYDVTILVNGLPLVHIELKKRGNAIREAFNQINRYQRDSFWSGSGLYQYVQLFVISNGTHTKYYSNTTRFQHIKDNAEKNAAKKKKTSNSFEFTSYWADEKNRTIPNLVDFTKTFFAKHTLLNILTRFGFTGTPIFASNSNSSNAPIMRTTAQVFGGEPDENGNKVRPLHAYTIVDAIHDGNVLPFRIDYINTIKNPELLYDKQVKAIDREKALLDPKRVSEITQYILEHFEQKTYRNQSRSYYDHKVITNVEKMAKSKNNTVSEQKSTAKVNGFNSIFAVASIPAAIAYYNEFKKQMEETGHKLNIATIFSFNPNEEDPDDILQDENFDTSGLDQTSRDFLDSAIDDYNKLFNVSYDTSADKFPNYYKDVSLRMKNREIDLLIVVNMFLTGFDATTLNTLWVDKNLKDHGLIQAFSRTNRILNSVKTFGNIVCFRNLETATNNALALFGDKNARGMVILKTYNEYMDGYEDEHGKHIEGYNELVARLEDEFPISSQIIGEDNEKEFIKLFGRILKLRNILRCFDDFESDSSVSVRDLQDYQSIYIDLYQDYAKKSDIEKERINDDIVFEIELIKQVEVNIDYILMLVAKYHESNCEDKTILANINKSIDASVELRSKKALIEGFVAQMTVKTDVEKDWKDFVKKQKEQDLEAIIKDEKLKHDEAQKFMENSFRDGGIKTTGTDLDKILPPISRFSGGSNRALKKQTVIDKLKDFFEKYFGLV